MTRSFKNIDEFRVFLRDEMPSIIAAGKRAGLEVAGDVFLKEIHSEIGHYQSGDAGFKDMAQLSPATLEGWEGIGGRLEGKIERGLATETEHNPLLASGAMGQSFGKVVDENRVQTGSNDPVAVYENQGTDSRGVPFVKGLTTQPGIEGREFIGRAGFRKAEEAVKAVSAAVKKAITE